MLQMEAEVRELEGEVVRPGALPGVLVGKTRVWRNGRETVTDCQAVFPTGAVAELSPTGGSGTPSLAARLWVATTSLTMLCVGLGAKLLLCGLNTTVVHGRENLTRMFSGPERSRPIVSVTNHQSCFDDPGVWGAVLSPSKLADTKRMRWGASASEVIFLNRGLAAFWNLGKVVPIVRGWGVSQPAMEFLLARLRAGAWVNIFPEGRVCSPGEKVRYRWGVGRLLADCSPSPLLLPVCHRGMEQVLPNPSSPGHAQPLLPRLANLVTVNIGRPVLLSAPAGCEDAEEAWTALTAEVQRVMEELAEETEELHRQNLDRWLARWHDGCDTTPAILT